MQKKNRGLSLWETSTTTPLIQIKGVSKKFGDFTAVDHVSLDIFEGELFCLLGGSGCGKTTLLRMLAGFEEPTTGSIEIDGQNSSPSKISKLTWSTAVKSPNFLLTPLI